MKKRPFMIFGSMQEDIDALAEMPEVIRKKAWRDNRVFDQIFEPTQFGEAVNDGGRDE